MKDNDKGRCFVLLGKFTGRKLSDEEKFAILLQMSSNKQKLEELYQNHSTPIKNQCTLNVLFRILQVQEVGSTEEYNVNGLVFKVHVLEDTDL